MKITNKRKPTSSLPKSSKFIDEEVDIKDVEQFVSNDRKLYKYIANHIRRDKVKLHNGRGIFKLYLVTNDLGCMAAKIYTYRQGRNEYTPQLVFFMYTGSEILYKHQNDIWRILDVTRISACIIKRDGESYMNGTLSNETWTILKQFFNGYITYDTETARFFLDNKFYYLYVDDFAYYFFDDPFDMFDFMIPKEGYDLVEASQKLARLRVNITKK